MTKNMLDRRRERKREELAARKHAEQSLKASVDREMSSGCMPCNFFRRKKTEAVRETELEEIEKSQQSSKTTKATAASAIFGLAKKNASPADKLAEAAEAIQSRAEALELKVGQGRSEARALMLGGQKKAAIRQLRRVKMMENQLSSIQSAADALEQQQLVLEQAALQKEMSSALSSSAKGLKSSKKLLKNAESAVEDASEARDVAEDLNSVLAEFSTSLGGEDDGELLEELHAMMVDNDGGGNGSYEGDDETLEREMRKDAERIEETDAAWQEARSLQTRMPRVPSSKTKKTEKEKLLAPGV